MKSPRVISEHKQLSRYFGMTVGTIVALVLCACTKAPVETKVVTTVGFVINWPATKAVIPSSGKVFLYPKLGGAPIELKITDNKTDQIDIIEGCYNIVVYNDNTENIQLRNVETLADFEAFLPLAQRSADAIIPRADPLFLIKENANRELEMIKNEPRTITLNPQASTQTYHFTIMVEAAVGFSSATATLSGISSRMKLFEAKPVSGEDVGTVSVELINNKADNTTLNGQVEVFGVDQSNRNPGSNIFTLDLVPTTPIKDITTHFVEDLTYKLNGYNATDLTFEIKVTQVPPVDPDLPIDPDPPVDPDKPVHIVITVTVKPWVEEDGGKIEINPGQTMRR